VRIRSGAHGAALAAAALLGGAALTPVGAHEPAPSANAILARVKAGLRASELPPYVSYTLVRRDTVGGVPDALNSSTLRIWCRSADSAALSRRVSGSETSGKAEFIVPAFDKPVDPGPPTANLLDVIHQTPAPAPPQPGAHAPRVIGSVSVVVETNYHVTFAGIDGDDDHLHLEARRDPDRNRLTDLYVDRFSYALHRAVARDHLYSAGRVIPQRFEIVFGLQDGVPVITAIDARTEMTALDAREPSREITYRFEDIRFPADLPAWYFQPANYGAHRSELPP
jgi:hypothetical protein